MQSNIKQIINICANYNVITPTQMRGVFVADSLLPPENNISIRNDFYKELDKIRTTSEKIIYIDAIITQFNNKMIGLLDNYPFVFQEYDELKKLQKKYNKDISQVGRPKEFDKLDSEKWFQELAKNPENQHKNGKPKKSILRELIRLKHKEKTGHLPSLKTIQRHI